VQNFAFEALWLPNNNNNCNSRYYKFAYDDDDDDDDDDDYDADDDDVDDDERKYYQTSKTNLVSAYDGPLMSPNLLYTVSKKRVISCDVISSNLNRFSKSC